MVSRRKLGCWLHLLCVWEHCPSASLGEVSPGGVRAIVHHNFLEIFVLGMGSSSLWVTCITSITCSTMESLSPGGGHWIVAEPPREPKVLADVAMVVVSPTVG